MKLFYSLLAVILLALCILPSVAPTYAALTYGNGVYTNLCGTGTAATANTCNKGCNPGTGTCTSDKPYVIKWTCNGNMQDCRLNETPFAATQNIGNTTCGQTVSIQVYNRNCRSYFGWICNESNLQDSLLWYSGDCGATSPATAQSASTTPMSSSTTTCSELTVSNGNNLTIPATVTLHAQSSGASKYRYYFGDGSFVESANSEASHRYDVSGTFIARAEVQSANGAWISSDRCETAVTVKPSSLETQKSDCSDLFVIDGNETQAPTTVSLRVTGYDNKGSIQKYKIIGEANQGVESTTGAFQIKFEKAGTYILRASILDSTNTWKAGGLSCTKTVYVHTQQLTSQPETGTPTAFTLVAITSGIVGISFLLAAKKPAKKLTKKRRS